MKIKPSLLDTFNYSLAIHIFITNQKIGRTKLNKDDKKKDYNINKDHLNEEKNTRKRDQRREEREKSEKYI